MRADTSSPSRRLPAAAPPRRREGRVAGAGGAGPWRRRIVRLGRRIAAVDASAWVLLALHTAYLVSYHSRPGREHALDADDVPRVALGYVTLLLGLDLIGLVTAARPRLRALAGFAYVGTYALLASYAAKTLVKFDYAVFRENLALATDPVARSVIAESIEPQLLIGGLVAAALASSSGWRRPPVRPPRGRARARLVAGGVAYACAVLVPSGSSDLIVGILQGAWIHHSLDLRAQAAARGLPEHPLIHAANADAATGAFDPARAPHVFLLMLESFNANYVESRAPDGRPYTPVFDALIRRGWYVERFYANSVQTSKGQFATLTSVIPTAHGKEFHDFARNRYQSLVHALRDRGYRTLFLQSHWDLAFDNTERFLTRLGFERCESVMNLLQPGDETQLLTWGPEDQVLYRRSLELLDRELAADQGPWFVTLATIGTHANFKVPPEKRTFFPRPRSAHERYADSIHVADRQLAVFFEELERRPALRDSLVIVTGDHSYPTGDHGIDRVEAGIYDESFRTPLLLIWPGRLEPRRIPGPHSQLDIAPTVLDLVGAPLARSHFQGRSLLAEGPPPPVYLVQPYAGAWLGVVDGPLKYLKQLRGGRELIFDLAADPGEQRDLVRELADDARVAALRDGVRTILATQHLVRTDRVWDAARRPRGSTRVIAHRGASRSAPENTLAAIAAAFDLGVDMVEVDVRLTRDGVPVLMHDETVERTTDGEGRVADLDLAELRALDAGSWMDDRFEGERVPTLVEALALARSRGGRLLLDPKVDGLGAAVSEALRAASATTADVVLGSWNAGQTRDFAKHLPGALVLRTGRIPRELPEDFFDEAKRRGVGGFEVGGNWSEQFSVLARAHRLPVYTYTVNDAPTLRRMIAADVTGIETDDPELLIELLQEAADRATEPPRSARRRTTPQPAPTAPASALR